MFYTFLGIAVQAPGFHPSASHISRDESQQFLVFANPWRRDGSSCFNVHLRLNPKSCSNLWSKLSVFSALFYMLRMKLWKMFCWLDHFLFFFKCYNYLKSLHIERQLTEYFTEINSFCPLLKFDYCLCCLGSPAASRKYFWWKKWLRFCRNLQRRREQVRRQPESRFQSALATEAIVECGANVGNLCCKFFGLIL